MAAFRRCVIALAVLALFAGLASAQIVQPMTCSFTSGFTANARVEGKTELLADMIMTCTGGTSPGAGALTTMNLTVNLPAAVTSRIVQSVASPAASVSEALLLIDDPGDGNASLVAGFGNGATPTVCQYSAFVNGCPSFLGSSGGFPIMTSLNGGNTTAANIYQGVITGTNAITFFGVPVLPPVTSGALRKYRFTNFRINASALAAGTNIIPSVGVTGGTASSPITFTQSGIQVGTVQTSLKVSVAGNAAFTTFTTITNCATASVTPAGIITFTELNPSAFRTRTAPNATAGSGFGGTLTQTTPQSTASYTESGYEIATPGATTGVTAGLADFGTRLKAVFSNVPAGVHVFVSVGNILNASATTQIASNVPVASAGNNNTNSLALLLGGAENASYLAATAATPLSFSAGGQPLSTTPFVDIGVPAGGGGGQAVWEILNTNTGQNEAISFLVWATVPAGTTTGQASVNLSYAPSGAAAPTPATTIPNFVDPNASTPMNSFLVSTCKSVLLFPFVSSLGGFDTGLAIANTSTDTGVYTTTPQNGTCTFNLYGTPTPVAIPPVTIASGNTAGILLSSLNPGFTGYSIATCTFNFAHGFAYVIDWTTALQSSAMGYLALEMGNGTTRNAAITNEAQGVH